MHEYKCKINVWVLKVLIESVIHNFRQAAKTLVKVNNEIHTLQMENNVDGLGI